jgi:cation transport ATPase
LAVTIELTRTAQDTRRARPAFGPVSSTVWRLPEVRWAATATVLFAVGGAAQLAGAPAPVWMVLYLACYLTGGWEPALAGWRALQTRTLDVDLLMVAAAIGAAAIGQVFDGALLIVIFATSGALEAVATHRTEVSVRSTGQDFVLTIDRPVRGRGLSRRRRRLHGR